MNTERTRVGFRPDRRLAAADLAAMGAHTGELLMLHQARLHGVWGIAAGYEASLSEGVVTVNPGLALDARGHSLLLPRTVSVPVPPLAAGERAVLVAGWADRPTLRCDGPVWAAESARLSWQRAGTALRRGLELAIAAAVRPAEGGEPALELGVRRHAHGLVRPKVATGHVPRGSVGVTGTHASWQVRVPTGAAGLTTAAPEYFVTLDDHPFGPNVGFDVDQAVAVEPELRLARWAGPFVAVEQHGRDFFTLRVSAGQPGWPGSSAAPALNPVGFSWLAVDTSFQPFVWFQLFPDLLVLSALFGSIHG